MTSSWMVSPKTNRLFRLLYNSNEYKFNKFAYDFQFFWRSISPWHETAAELCQYNMKDWNISSFILRFANLSSCPEPRLSYIRVPHCWINDSGICWHLGCFIGFLMDCKGTAEIPITFSLNGFSFSIDSNQLLLPTESTGLDELISTSLILYLVYLQIIYRYSNNFIKPRPIQDVRHDIESFLWNVIESFPIFFHWMNNWIQSHRCF